MILVLSHQQQLNGNNSNYINIYIFNLSNALLAFNDTITVDNSKYIKYEVKVGDSMNSIA